MKIINVLKVELEQRMPDLGEIQPENTVENAIENILKEYPETSNTSEKEAAMIEEFDEFFIVFNLTIINVIKTTIYKRMTKVRCDELKKLQEMHGDRLKNETVSFLNPFHEGNL